MSKRLFWLTGLFVVLALLLAACGGGAAPEVETVEEAPAEEAVVEEEAMEEEAAAEEEAMEEEAMEEEAPAAEEVDTSSVTELSIIWAEWDPANFLQQLVNEYTEETGVKVTVVQEPWGTFQDRVFTEFAGQGATYDIVVGDSQWLGQGATQGHYIELTDVFFDRLNGDALAPPTVAAYAEYPKGSGRMWAYPTEGDANGWAYRQDLFEDPAEQAAFMDEYGYELAVPETMEQLRDIAEFFTRPDDNLYGLAIYTQKDYDALTMGFENVLWNFGGAWGDDQTYEVDGILNSEGAVEALEFYKELYGFTPPGSGNVFWQESLDAYLSGQVAMSMNFFAFFPGMANPAINPFADVTGYFSNPAGPAGRFTALGGQGMSIVSYVSPERQAAALDFLEWFGQDDVQLRWAELGGYTNNVNVLNSEAFLENTPYNRAFSESMQMVRDFWAVPVYGEVMEAMQRELHNYIVADEGTAQETLDNMAQISEEIFAEAGLLQEGAGEAAAEAPAETGSDIPSSTIDMSIDTSGVTELSIIWAEWDPANFLQQLVNEYTEETGVKVTVVQEPWGTFQDRVFTEFAGQGATYDIVVGDSQWLGQGATQGHYVELTDFFFENLNGEALAPPTVAAYAEYPKGSGRMWAYPTEGDANGWAYRQDLFEDPAEQAAFMDEYGYELAVPETMEQLRDIAEFFTRPDDNLYGLAIYTQKDYDALTMGFENVLWNFGGAWGDDQTYEVDGILNSEGAVEALEFYKELYSFTPPGSGNVFWQESLDAYLSGQVAMSMNFFAFFPGMANPAINPFAEVTGYFSNPAGPAGRFTALGGQGMSIISYVPPERQAAALEFLEWFGQDDVQQRWAELGGYTNNVNILNSEAFLENTPYNRAFSESMQMVRDFWAVPVYGEVMEAMQRELHNYIVADEGTAQETLDNMAAESEEIFRDAGLLSE